MNRRLFGVAVKEQLRWISGRTVNPKCAFSGGPVGKRATMHGSQGKNIVDSPWGRYGLQSKVALSTPEADFVMVRSLEGLGGLRGITNRPGDRSGQHGVRNVFPATDEERHTDEFLKQAKKEQADKVRKIDQAISGVAGQSLAATDSEFVQNPGQNTSDTQRCIGDTMARNSDLNHSDREQQHMDPNGESPEVDEEVKRGLVADSAFSMGRREKKDEDDDLTAAEVTGHPGTTCDILEHGSFKSHL